VCVPVPNADGLIVLCEEELSQGPGDITAHPEEYSGIVHGVDNRILVWIDTSIRQEALEYQMWQK
jgi:hypothetical protein